MNAHHHANTKLARKAQNAPYARTRRNGRAMPLIVLSARAVLE